MKPIKKLNLSKYSTLMFGLVLGSFVMAMASLGLSIANRIQKNSAGQLKLDGNTISSSEGNIHIEPAGAGQVLLKANPISNEGAATKQYVDTTAKVTLKEGVGIKLSTDANEVTVSADLTSGEFDQLKTIGSSTVSSDQWGYVGGLNQALSSTDSPTFSELTLSGFTHADKGTVSQETNNSTSVTINSRYGVITMFAVLSSATSYSFTVNNNTVVSTSTIMVSVVSSHSPPVSVGSISNGSFTILIRNVDGAEDTGAAPIIHFWVLNGS